MAVDVGDVMDTKYAMLDAMPSQFYEWLPWVEGVEGVPEDPDARRDWLQEQWDPLFLGCAEQYVSALEDCYGDAVAVVRYCEAFELCEYGRQPGPDELKTLFPF